jgi:hypothetical protein
MTVPPKPDITLGRYRHYKGSEYEVVGVACDEGTLTWMVMYRPLYESEGPDCWLRPYENFFENVDVEGKQMARFTYIDKG